MSLITINEQIERYSALMQGLNKAQAIHVKGLGGVFVPMFKEANILVKEMHQMFKNYKKDVQADIDRRRKDLAVEQYALENRLFNDRFRTLLALTEQHKELKEALNQERQDFSAIINDINRQIGEFTHIWGDYVEKCAVDSAQKILTQDFNTLNYASKVKRTIVSDTKPKRQHLEIDFLAESEDTVYIVEVKSTIRQETFRQVIHNLARLDTFLPQYKHYKKQPIVAFLSEEEGVSDMLFTSGVWLMQPKISQPDGLQSVDFELMINT